MCTVPFEIRAAGFSADLQNSRPISGLIRQRLAASARSRRRRSALFAPPAALAAQHLAEHTAWACDVRSWWKLPSKADGTGTVEMGQNSPSPTATVSGRS